MTKATPPPTTDLKEVLQAIAQISMGMNMVIKAAAEALQKSAPQIIAVTDGLKNSAPKILALIEAVRRMPDVLQAALIQLADEGWYLDWEEMSLSEPAELAEAFLAGHHQEIEGRLVAHYRHRLAAIEEVLVELLPSRAHIFRQAFDAHRQGLYYASVPTFLAQVDGVCWEYLDEHFFMGTKSKARERFAKLANLDGFTKALLAPFFSDTSIRLSTKERPMGFDKLNRHLVLHGVSLDYGTEVRGLQAVSLLHYVAISLGRVLDRHQLPLAGDA